MRKTESVKTTDELVARFHQRYINLAAITTDARTISSQVWVKDQQDVYDAEAILCKWATPREEKWHGKILVAVMHDPDQGIRQFKRVEAGLREVL